MAITVKPDVARAADSLAAREYPTYDEMLDVTILNRVGRLLGRSIDQLTDGTRTVKSALLGTVQTPHTLLTFSEIRDFLRRNNSGYQDDDSHRKTILVQVTQSLERTGLAREFKDLGISVGFREIPAEGYAICFTIAKR